MKQYIIIKRAQTNELKDEVNRVIYTEDNVKDALDLCKVRNKYIHVHHYKWEVIELTSLLETKNECDMTDNELKEYNETLNEIDKDLHEAIDYDEWSAKEYGETKVDYYWSARNLYNMGYRKITIVEE